MLSMVACDCANMARIRRSSVVMAANCCVDRSVMLYFLYWMFVSFYLMVRLCFLHTFYSQVFRRLVWYYRYILRNTVVPGIYFLPISMWRNLFLDRALFDNIPFLLGRYLYSPDHSLHQYCEAQVCSLINNAYINSECNKRLPWQKMKEMR